jgi:hypothetical protein
MKSILTLVLMVQINAQVPPRAHNKDPEALGAALKYIPEEVSHHYNFIDPKKKWEPNHNITAEDLKLPVRDVTREKSHEDIPRVPDHLWSEEDIPDDEHMIHAEHYEHGSVDHHDALRTRRIAHEKIIRNLPAYSEIEEHAPFEPERGFSVEFVYAMLFKVHFRDRFMRKPYDDLVSNAITIERDLYNEEVNY